MPASRGQPRRQSAAGGSRGARAGSVGGGSARGGAVRRERTARSEPARSIRADAGRVARPAQRGRPMAASRPAGVRRPNTGAAATRTRAPRPRRLTGRAAVLGMVMIGLLLAYAYPVRVYLAQQAEIAGIEQQQRAQRDRIRDLAQQRQKWEDPEFVKAQAKKELHYVLPGETPLVPLPDEAGAGGESATPASGDAVVADPWYKKLWSSVEVANAS
jgi:cell division protein FtsB